MVNEKTGNIEIKLQNNDPKDNPKSYQISTLQDIADCVTPENITGFLKDFEGCLRSYHLMQAILKAAVDEGRMEESKLEFPSFTWIDDWKPEKED